MRPLDQNDFPLVAQGANIYRRTESSPMCVCPDDHTAAELAARLNRDVNIHGPAALQAPEPVPPYPFLHGAPFFPGRSR